MCGIWAVFGSDENVSAQCNAVHKITHRGPDAFRIENIHHFQNCCLGFHRLSIVDDLRGMQPLRLYTYPHTYLIYNGEIYNHKTLAKEFDMTLSTEVDGEPMIHLYQTHGPVAMAEKLDGVFAFCILDTANRKVILGRDTFGVRPLFRFCTKEGFLAVCSEAKGLFGLSHSENDEDLRIEPFPPGHVEVYDIDSQGRAFLRESVCFNKTGQIPKYQLAVPPESYATDVKKNVAMLLEKAVEKRLMSDRRVGCLLSGGLDSSLVAALVVKLSKKLGITYPIQTFAIGMEGSTDLKAAKKVATHLGTEHHEILMTPEEGIKAIDDTIRHLESYDITTVRASVGMYLLSKYVQEKTDTVVVMSGEGADEVAQGYIYFHNAPSAQAAHEESVRLMEDLYMYDVLRGDRSTAAWGLEIRVPFLDHQFTSYYLSLDSELRQPKDGVEKHLIRSSFDETGLLPSEILWRPKEAFSDGIASLTKSWFEIIQDVCKEKISQKELDSASSVYPHNPPHTKEALYFRKLFEQHYPGKAYWIPYYWLPAWTKTDEPSARTLKHYKQ
ncbi:asparagine synthetase [glutamine-hydrolyzing] [Elysia marginata]|uniref:Asparagine synthetase [glutamine-hydrolyzing] n=1 Tax=Elysia marginata TaxID=1093978 RepID=A0AAV4F019_9GAST|nr:asparagine synthetase [glutamine-hydrolyzing] [Elysia marginata]